MPQQTEINIKSYPNKVPKIKKKSLWKRIWEHRVFYFFLLPGIIWFVIFSYIPMYGITIAFKDFNFVQGILGSPWAGLKYFHQFFNYYQSKEIIRNTIVISLMKLLIGFPMPIILALLLNEIRISKFKKTVQTISYLPHFISWVVVVTLLQRLLTPYGGPVNELIAAMGLDRIQFLGNINYFYQLIISSDIWKGVGWGAIIYLAAISGVDTQLYEAAKMDGANRFRQMWHVTLPSIRGVMVILFILACGGIMSAGYEQLLLMNTPATTSIGNVLDVYVIKAGLEQGRFSYATAVGLFQGIIGLILIIAANQISKKVNETSLW
ncbi:putative aldouronate transport system permease protein [Pullulanibacillus pueri]|uniref:Putative multiple-sugar transport system permease YteP n=1 Tax=Pullulanibacillus pueri TaxID=1437324 RepID=A0A8J3ELP2_9BACL|nr:ABC transporter permease subunit [Pullulanibacillus pueri]MBM7681140.1 putative aldouronate transport system permease protein [Pullulanibacillus pueri]GGH77201.1 putative multiple-sugar transport system permease YteP [Pullulanibacillus pueri]